MPAKKKANTSKVKKLSKQSCNIEVIDSSEYKKKNPEKNLFGEGQLERLVSEECKADLMVEKTLSGLPESFSLLLLTTPESYYGVKSSIIRRLSGQKGIYVTINNPFSSIKDEISKYSVDSKGIFFVDLVSKMTSAKMPEEKNVQYLESATDLTELMMFIDKRLTPSASPIIVFDSLSTLLVYNEPRSVEKLVHMLVGKADSFSSRLVLLMVKSREHEGTIETIGQFCSKVAKIDKLEI